VVELIGRTLGGYRIEEVIGSGDRATVYKAYRAPLRLHVAIKVLSEQLSRDEEMVWRFEREARAAARLRHPHIASIYHIGQEGGVHYLAMDYVDGPSLAVKLQEEGPIGLEAALAILGPVGAALDFAHGEGIIHGNVKPSNILLGRDGRVVLTDVAGSASGPALGRLAYLSPEQAEGNPPSGRSDVYSLGVVLYEMLTGRVPFADDAPGVAVDGHLHQPPPAPSSLNPDISPAVEKVILRALSKPPGKRYKSAGELLRALAEAGGLPLPGNAREGSLYPLGRAFPPVGLWAGAALLLLLGVTMLWFLASRSAPTPAPTPAAHLPGVALADTATPAASPTVTASPTRRAATATPTASPSPVPSPTPPTETPIPTAPPPTRAPRPVAVATATLVPAPQLLAPPDGSSMEGGSIAFRWQSDYPLQPGEHYDLRVWREGTPPYGIAWTREPSYRLDRLEAGSYRWSVAVIRETGTRPDGEKEWAPVSGESPAWSFGYWPQVAPPPTAAPAPTPTKPPPPPP
jgi:serine/threonine-protein kinase